MPCVIAKNGDEWTIDETHPAYPRGCLAGTALKAILASIGIEATPDCPCTARAREMDVRGCDWCEENIDTIVGWLREQAEARGLPFVEIAAKLLIKRAIHNARKAARADKME